LIFVSSAAIARSAAKAMLAPAPGDRTVNASDDGSGQLPEQLQGRVDGVEQRSDETVRMGKRVAHADDIASRHEAFAFAAQDHDAHIGRRGDRLADVHEAVRQRLVDGVDRSGTVEPDTRDAFLHVEEHRLVM
jgi:hypothetical protein